MNFDSKNEFIKIIDFISNDTIKAKKEMYQKENNNNIQENDQSNSNCLLF